MNPARKRKLTIILFLLAGLAVAVGLTTYAFRQNINLFYDPTQIAEGEAPVDVRIRAGGMVEDGSVVRDPDSLKVEFRVTDFTSAVTVRYEGILPDLFAEGQGVVTTGQLNSDRVFVAEQVLAKHDEKYMPPEVSDALEKSKARAAEEGREMPEY
ncbi:cytochrome c maturation protein CcmE [Marinobacter zhanjiangensis]|uniref:Cytochrome c-type biogenesis protein CcmE n=1 Tax=Marinobacter zhanjiangensis TaxID=578215 RepID=A0ABQ3AQU0_9GAMM|nr:cytochrome c maturation protein CcmE [Marinobacter zhanjiangensis]GGY63887.1 cytochrome c-type biogenesis protein CcmE [Marinobacter zhanjiangensis]